MGNPAWGWVVATFQVGFTFCKSQNLGSKNQRKHLFFTPLAKGKLKKTTVLFEQNKQRSISLRGIAVNLTGMTVWFHLSQRGVDLQIGCQSGNRLEMVRNTCPSHRGCSSFKKKKKRKQKLIRIYLQLYRFLFSLSVVSFQKAYYRKNISHLVLWNSVR